MGLMARNLPNQRDAQAFRSRARPSILRRERHTVAGGELEIRGVVTAQVQVSLRRTISPVVVTNRRREAMRPDGIRNTRRPWRL